MVENKIFQQSANQSVLQSNNKNNNKQQNNLCTPVFSFIILGFFFLALALIEILTNQTNNSYSFDMKNNNGVLSSSQKYTSFSESDQVAIYLSVPQLTQFNYLQQQHNFMHYQSSINNQNCGKFKTNYDLGKTRSFLNTPLINNDSAIPCGYYAGFFPIKQIQVKKDKNIIIPLLSSPLTYFQQHIINIKPNSQWVDLNNPLFQTWMESNANINNHKLIGIIQGKFQGSISFQIQLNEGLPQKLTSATISLINNKALGGFNLQFSISNFIQSFICFLFACLIFGYDKLPLKQTSSPQTQQKQDTTIQLNVRNDSECSSKI